MIDQVQLQAQRLRDPLIGLGFEFTPISRDLGRGTAFPSSSAIPGGLQTGDRFFRTDFGISFAYDGAAWYSLPKFTGARVFNSTGQTITTATPTALTFDSENYDTSAFHSTSSNTSRLTIPTGLDGYYIVGANIFWTATAGGRRYLRLQTNGTTIVAGVEIGSVADATAAPSQMVEVPLLLSAGDYVEVVVLQSSGGNLNISTAVLVPNFWMYRLG